MRQIQRFTIVVFFFLTTGRVAAEVQDCLTSTGYAFEDRSSVASLSRSGNVTTEYLFAPAAGPVAGTRFVSCAPPIQTSNGSIAPKTSTLTSADGSTETSVVAGIGIHAGTSALTNPGPNTSTSKVDTHLNFALNVISEDSSFTGNTELTVKALFDFGVVQGSVSNGARLTIDFDNDFILRTAGLTPFSAGWAGPTGVLDNLSQQSVLVERTWSVPVNYTELLHFEHELSVLSLIQGAGALVSTSSGSAQAAVTVSYEFSVAEGFTVSFPFVDELGYPAPQLGVIAPAPVPLPPAIAMILPAAILLWRRSGKCGIKTPIRE